MNYILKTTNQLSKQEKENICDLFFKVFAKHMSLSMFEQKFTKNILGYSYHGIMKHEGHVVGAYSTIPYKYTYYGKEVIFGLSVDTMIDEKFRGNKLSLATMSNLVYNALIKDNIPFVFGFPNDMAYFVRKKRLNWQDIGRLDFYVLPIKIAGLSRRLKIFNSFSYFAAYILNYFSNSELININSSPIKPIDKINDISFLENRYNSEYYINYTKNGFFVYKNVIENNVKVSYVLDVYPMDKISMQNAVTYIFNKEKKYIDLIIYVGKLDFSVFNLYKLPAILAPKKVYMSGRILNSDVISLNIFDINNWNVNLSNYDVR